MGIQRFPDDRLSTVNQESLQSLMLLLTHLVMKMVFFFSSSLETVVFAFTLGAAFPAV